MHEHFEEMLNTMEKHGVKYLIVGGHAVMTYTEPRFTKDLGLFVENSPENAENVYRALADFGAPLEGLSAEDFTRPGNVYQIGVPPLRVDILMGIEGVSFADAWPNRESRPFGANTANYISKRDLIRNKKAIGRYIDLHDVELLELNIDSD